MVCYRPVADIRRRRANDRFRSIANVTLLMHSDGMRSSLAALATGVVIIVTMAGCSATYDIKVLRRDGQMIFRFNDAAFWAGNTARVVSLSVAPTSGLSGPVWEVRSKDINGLTMDQIRYGVVPTGMSQTVVPVELRLGGSLSYRPSNARWWRINSVRNCTRHRSCTNGASSTAMTAFHP